MLIIAAYWHIILPIEFIINLEQKADFDKDIGKNYSEYNTYETKSHSPLLPDGNRLEFINTYCCYIINEKEKVLLNIAEFIMDFYSFFKSLYPKNSIPMENAFLEDEYQHFAKQLVDINFTDITDICQQLRNCEENYFVNYETISSICVYEGYPLNKKTNSTIEGFSIMYSYFKMGENIDTYSIFKETVHLFNKEYEEKYVFAKNLIVMGY